MRLWDSVHQMLALYLPRRTNESLKEQRIRGIRRWTSQSDNEDLSFGSQGATCWASSINVKSDVSIAGSLRGSSKQKLCTQSPEMCYFLHYWPQEQPERLRGPDSMQPFSQMIDICCLCEPPLGNSEKQDARAFLALPLLELTLRRTKTGEIALVPRCHQHGVITGRS